MDLLPEQRSAELRDQTLTYPEPGATRTGGAPPGFRAVHRSVQVPGDLDLLTRSLMTWVVHQRAGLSVSASSPRVAEGEVVELGFGFGPFRLRAPCRVVYVVDEPDRRGFAYGTLPGHPESGEEVFLLTRSSAGVVFSVAAFSRPASGLARVSGPVGRVVQDLITTRYLNAFARR